LASETHGNVVVPRHRHENHPLPSAGIATIAILAGQTFAAGTLTPVGSPQAPIEIRDHHVAIVINNGFARTEVMQTFFNPNAQDLEAVYAFPVPRARACRR